MYHLMKLNTCIILQSKNTSPYGFTKLYSVAIDEAPILSRYFPYFDVSVDIVISTSFCLSHDSLSVVSFLILTR